MNEEYAIQAGIIVERQFPPTTTDGTLRVLVSLNLLNAVVKQSWGRRLVSYNYIKGMAAAVLLRLLDVPIKGVSAYWDSVERIVYFTVLGVQVSFHYIPLSVELLAKLAEVYLERQEWCGMQLQKIAVEVFLMAVSEPVAYTPEEETYVRYVMLHYGDEPPSVTPEAAVTRVCQSRQEAPAPIHFCEDKLKSLCVALQFRIWEQSIFTLWRRKDRRKVPIVRYDGSNYRSLMDYLLGPFSRIRRRPRKSLEKGKFYYVTPQKKVRCVGHSHYIQLLTRNSYLCTSHGYFNLCVTYGIARYLGMMHPTLKFVCTLNFNHLPEQRVYYTYYELVRIPLFSQARMLKVWIIIDTANLLSDFHYTFLPQALIDDYIETEDYYQEFEVVSDGNGRQGIVAYRRYQLLETKYRRIVLINYHAHVLGDNGLWAIFSLNQECFCSGFVYTKIWYDVQRGQILGSVNGKEKVIYTFGLMRLV